MNSTTHAIRELARRLVDLEAQGDARPVVDGGEAARVCEKIRLSLAKLAGTAGYHSLISRAIAMAKAEAPVLDSVQVRSDGSLEGFDENGKTDANAGVAVVVHLLSLLVTFVGEPLTLGLVSNAWTDAALMGSRAEEQ